MNDNCLKDIKIIKSWISPGAGNAIMIDGIYKEKNIIAKLGFIPGIDGHKLYKHFKEATFVFGLDCEKDVNEKLINNMKNPYIVKMLKSCYLTRELVDIHLKEDLIKLEQSSIKLCKQVESWCGFDFSNLIIMIFEKVENHVPLYKFKGNLKDWLDILWNICQALNIFNLYGLRHNDLNWSNILVIKNLECTTIKIIDYGTSSVQPTKLNNKLKIINKTGFKEHNKKDLLYDINKFIRGNIGNKNIPKNILKIIKNFKNKTPKEALKIIQNYK
jgi:hypothetical protein